MSNQEGGSLKKLTIISFTDDGFSSKNNSYQVLINPADYKQDFTIDYSSKSGTGGTEAAPAFEKYGDEGISFDLYFDGTGLIDGQQSCVHDQIEGLKKCIYNYNGDIHQPNYVEICWGELLFKGRLKSLSLNYTMFKPNGDPLRAKASLSFTSYTNPQEAAKEANKSSPDLSHLIEFKQGDTLPNLCRRIYQDPTFYTAIARKNNLINFRDIKPGTKLIFPPLK